MVIYADVEIPNIERAKELLSELTSGMMEFYYYDDKKEFIEECMFFCIPSRAHKKLLRQTINYLYKNYPYKNKFI